ncbi:ROK family transcriptional regulator [Pleomorphomonas sp. NRK KF1]|uniref:ROK family transcriptional regulator n=1 Tax=Pleomorphomonas sp. NRK KF1 TaxID=2943000 RepID=UPI00204346DA|nr:ROK family transcriptional regulator [Pleomorphomonas sp. NRK KF1]MCM5553698.1 ROK family transcriptional regulator [Pleomorphomonas sp. NRK KF1]
MIPDDTATPVLRQISVRAVMDVLLNSGATSRAALAKITGLSKQTMSEVIRVLESGGFVRIKGVTSGKVGRAAVIYEVDPSAGYVIGAELGVTSLRLSLANIVGDILASEEAPSDDLTGTALVSALGRLSAELIAKAGVDRQKVLVAAVAMPGVVEPVSGRLSLSPNLEGLGDVDVRTLLSAELGCAVVIENDINAAVIGESWTGCAVGVDEVAFVSLGTGIGLGALTGGRLIRGASGAAGEIGFLPIGGDPTASDSLERGALESTIGRRGIRERYRALGGAKTSSPSDIFAAALEGQDEAAVTAARDLARTAALAMVAVHALLEPRKIVVGGIVGCLPGVVDWIRAELPQVSRRPIVVEVSALGARAALTGAVAIALNQAHNLLFSPADLPMPLRLPSAAHG